MESPREIRDLDLVGEGGSDLAQSGIEVDVLEVAIGELIIQSCAEFNQIGQGLATSEPSIILLSVHAPRVFAGVLVGFPDRSSIGGRRRNVGKREANIVVDPDDLECDGCGKGVPHLRHDRRQVLAESLAGTVSVFLSAEEEDIIDAHAFDGEGSVPLRLDHHVGGVRVPTKGFEGTRSFVRQRWSRGHPHHQDGHRDQAGEGQ